jgi:hypothetical protein
MLGPSRRGRYLLAVLIETDDPGRWRVVTAYWMTEQRARGIYDMEADDGQEG